MKNVELITSAEQLSAICRQLDFAVSVHLCQFKEIEILARAGEIKHRTGRTLNHDEVGELNKHLEAICTLFGFSSGASFAISSSLVAKDAKRGYEVKKVAERELAILQNPSPVFKGVNYDGLIVRYTDDPAPIASVVGNAE